MMSIPHEYAGVAGGIFNSALQLGVVIGLSIATGASSVARAAAGAAGSPLPWSPPTAIQISFPAVEGLPMPRWKGYQSACVPSSPSLRASLVRSHADSRPPPTLDSFFFLMACMLLAIVLILIFFEDPVKVRSEDDIEGGSTTDEPKRPAVAIA